MNSSFNESDSDHSMEKSSRTTRPQTGWHGWHADAPQPAIAPFSSEQAKKHQKEWADYLKVPVEYTNSIGMKFRLIPPGEFIMGSTPDASVPASPVLVITRIIFPWPRRKARRNE